MCKHLTPERKSKSARVSKITHDGSTWSGRECFIHVAVAMATVGVIELKQTEYRTSLSVIMLCRLVSMLALTADVESLRKQLLELTAVVNQLRPNTSARHLPAPSRN